MINIIKRIAKDIKQYWIAIVLIAIYNIFVRVIFHAFCPSWIIIGLPCPGCGITRASFYLVLGQVDRAYRLNPSVFVWTPFIIYGVICRYILGVKVKYCNVFLIIVCISSILIHMYRMVYIFPSNPPLTYNYHCVMKKIFPDYVKLLRIIFES